MNTKYINKLEFYKITDMLSNFCVTYKGKEFSFNLAPSNDKNIVKQLLEETSEAVNLSYRNGIPSFYDFSDIALDLKKVKCFIR